ncbi:hypothetical protein AAULH_14271, partial [Lactobacillus helveticus MTCC 5463]
VYDLVIAAQAGAANKIECTQTYQPSIVNVEPALRLNTLDRQAGNFSDMYVASNLAAISLSRSSK